MLDSTQESIAYHTLLNLLTAAGVISKDAAPDWPMLIFIAEEYTAHLNQGDQTNETNSR
jgi:hypothetical protein